MRLAKARVNPLAPDALRPAAGARAAVAAADQPIQSIDPPAGPCALEREKGGLDKREKRGGWRLNALERVRRRQARAGFCRSPSPFPTRNRPRKIPSRRTIQTPQRLNFGRAVLARRNTLLALRARVRVLTADGTYRGTESMAAVHLSHDAYLADELRPATRRRARWPQAKRPTVAH